MGRKTFVVEITWGAGISWAKCMRPTYHKQVGPKFDYSVRNRIFHKLCIGRKTVVVEIKWGVDISWARRMIPASHKQVGPTRVGAPCLWEAGLMGHERFFLTWDRVWQGWKTVWSPPTYERRVSCTKRMWDFSSHETEFAKDEKLSYKTLIYMQSVLLRCARTHYLEKDLVKLKNKLRSYWLVDPGYIVF